MGINEMLHHPPINVLTGKPFRVYAIDDNPLKRHTTHRGYFFADGKCVGYMLYQPCLQTEKGGATFYLNDYGKSLPIKRPTGDNAFYRYDWYMAIARAIRCVPIDICIGSLRLEGHITDWPNKTGSSRGDELALLVPYV